VDDETKAHDRGGDSDLMGGRSTRPGGQHEQGDVMGGRSADKRQRKATESGPRRSFRPSLRQRVETWWKRDGLDEQLAQGADPNASAELRLRAAQLTSPAGRVELADAVETVLREARGRDAGAQGRPEDLLALAERLRAERPIDVRGAAMTRRLLTDLARARPVGRVPLRATTALYRSVGRVPYRATSRPYGGDTESSLQQAVRSAQRALEPAQPDEGSFRSAA
jgi:hypothetical protein